MPYVGDFVFLPYAAHVVEADEAHGTREDVVAEIEKLQAELGVVVCQGAAGKTIVSKGRFYAEKGSKLTIKATVKEHSIYKDERQTLVQRIKEAA